MVDSGNTLGQPPKDLGQKLLRPVAVAVAVVIALVAGGLLLARSLSSPSGPTGYLDANSSTAVFIQMTKSGESVVGTMSVASIVSSDHDRVRTAHSGFTGVVHGNSITLSFGSALLGAVSVSGTLEGSTLVLTGPGSGGLLALATFHSATVAAYNHAVAELQRSAAAAYRRQQEQAAAAARAQARQQADEAVVQAASTLTNSLATLQEDDNFTSALKAMSRSLAKTQDALVKT